MSNNINQKVGKATAWSSITEIMAKLISPIVNMIMARLLVPEAFGVVATITMVISFAEIFTDAGFQKYLIQHEFENEDDLNKSTNVAFWTNLSISMLACLIIFFFRHQIAKLVGSPELGDSISISSVLIVIAAFSSIQMARYKREFDFRTLIFVRIGTSLIPLVVTIPLAIVLRNYWAVLIGNFTSHLFNAIVLTVKSKWKPRLYYNLGLFKQMFSFSAWTLLESISIWLTSYIGVFIVGNYLSDYYLGLYKTSMSTVNSYMAIITASITPVLFSALSRYQNDDSAFRRTYYTFQRLVAIFVIPMSIGIYIYRDLVTQILLGSQWMEASGFIGLWGLMSGFTVVFSHFSSEVYRSKGQPKISLLSQLIHLAFLIPILFLSVRYGFETLYIGRSLARIQIIITAVIIMRICFKFRVIDVLKNVFPAITSALVMGIGGFFLQRINSHIIWQIVSVPICIVIYFTVLFVCFPKMRREIMESSYIKKLKRKFLKH